VTLYISKVCKVSKNPKNAGLRASINIYIYSACHGKRNRMLVREEGVRCFVTRKRNKMLERWRKGGRVLAAS
jgi:hypothetical protein